MTEFQKLIRNLQYFPFFLITGVSAGIVGYLFRNAIKWAGDQRLTHPFLLFLLPVTGLLVHFLYTRILPRKESGAKALISAVKNNTKLSFLQIPLVFFSSVLTHLSGGSAGREGAVLEMGGVLGNRTIALLRFLTKKKNLHLVPDCNDKEKALEPEEERKTAILCGMAGAFSALFVTPLAAIFFVLEITDSHQIIHRFIPVFLVSIISFIIVCFLGCEPVEIQFHFPNPLPSVPFVKTAFLAAGIAMISRFFIFSITAIPSLFRWLLQNDYIRSAAAATSLLLLTSLLGTNKFNGLGSDVIHQAITGKAGPLDFFWKTLFTALTLAAGLKGGEIIPLFFVGATFGVTFSELIGFLPDFGGTIGMVTILAAAAKTPIAAVLLGVELFGIDGFFFYLLASLIAWSLSGKQGLYR